jgi:hypothetical protein
MKISSSNSKAAADTNIIAGQDAFSLTEKTKKAGNARFSASGLAGYPGGFAASTSVVSVAPVRSEGSSLPFPATAKSCTCRFS